MELTAEQQAIIGAGATDLVVIAGAGSGKTHVLVERYLRLLASCRIPEIAAVTFTEAAATEMRERVRRAVMTDPALSDDRRDMDEATIGTVHALARRLLCEHPVEAAIDPAADVLADDEAELLRRIACAGGHRRGRRGGRRPHRRAARDRGLPRRPAAAADGGAT